MKTTRSAPKSLLLTFSGTVFIYFHSRRVSKLLATAIPLQKIHTPQNCRRKHPYAWTLRLLQHASRQWASGAARQLRMTADVGQGHTTVRHGPAMDCYMDQKLPVGRKLKTKKNLPDTLTWITAKHLGKLFLVAQYSCQTLPNAGAGLNPAMEDRTRRKL